MTRLTPLALLVAASIVVTGCKSNAAIIAHRGASYLAPENTVASAKLAWWKRADAVEVDVYLSSDNQVVVIHDKTTKRTAGGEELDVATSTAEQLRQLDVGSFKSETYAGERIPLLSEIIATVPPGKKLIVEIKCGPEVLGPLEEAIDAGGKRDQIVIIGFGLDTVKASKQRMPDLPTYWLTGTSATCTGIFKPVYLGGAGLPDLGPEPTGVRDTESLWWAHERLHRAVIRDYPGRLPLYRPERDALEASFLSEAADIYQQYRDLGNSDRAQPLGAFTASCFERAAAATARWTERVSSVPSLRFTSTCHRQASWS